MKKIVYFTIIFSFLFTFIATAEMRTWTSAEGQHKIQATFQTVSDDGKTITLQQANGKTTNIALEKLSKADQEYIRKLQQGEKVTTEKVVNKLEIRTWTTTSGRKIEATLAGISKNGKSIILRDSKGNDNEGALSTLSKEDQEYVQQNKGDVKEFVPKKYKSPYKNIWDATRYGTVQDVESFVTTRNINNVYLGQTNLDTGFQSGDTLLHIAAGNRRVEVAKFLVEKGARYTTNDHGWFPLHSAAYFKNPEVVEFFISKGANVNVRTKNGLTPLDSVLSDNHPVVDILVAHGARRSSSSSTASTPPRTTATSSASNTSASSSSSTSTSSSSTSSKKERQEERVTCSSCKGLTTITKRCDACNGRGKRFGKCFLCDGSGKVKSGVAYRGKGPEQQYTPCHRCNGTGIEDCSKCKSTGTLTTSCYDCGAKGYTIKVNYK